MRTTLVRAMVLSAAAFAGALTPVTCLGEDGNQLPTKATKELSPELLSLFQQKRMVKNSPILVRIFKEEAELEVWKQDITGHFQILKVYPICRWSGDLGPKLHEGDRQAPEGFYTITPQLMNPNSNYYLAINTGFPNSFDKANDRDGNFLMIHGDCSSSGCYAMTDEQMDEIYSLARESLLGSQPSFQIQAYPFRMTPANLARHRTNPHMAFWKMLKIGNDHFEATHLEPKVDVCYRHYVFNAYQPLNSSQPLVFDPTGNCPAFVVNPRFARLALEKQHVDEFEYAKLVENNVPVAAVYSGLDGGMNTIFLARFPGKIIPLAMVLPPTGIGLPQLPPVPWADNDRSFSSKFFGALFELKPASRTQVATTESATQEPGADLATTKSNATPTARAAPQIETVVAAKPRSGEPRENQSANDEVTSAESYETVAAQLKPVPQHEAAAPPASDTPVTAPAVVPADSFVSRWRGLH
jgi:murein L,D-transpeptidase YafK